MSAVEARRFLTAIESDQALANRIAEVGNDPAVVHALVRSAGFECTREEIKDAFLEAHGAQLSPEQLDAIAGGLSDEETGALIGLGVAGYAGAMALAAAF